jgi:hypothetical protein
MPTAFAPPRAVDAPRMAPTFVSTLLQSFAVRGERVDSIRFLQQTIQAAATTRIERTATTVHIATPAAQDARAERVHRAAAAAPGRSAATSPRRHDAAPAAAPARSAEPAAQLARTADLNIDRLADRVVHAIDRRLVAQRERHGRL